MIISIEELEEDYKHLYCRFLGGTITRFQTLDAKKKQKTKEKHQFGVFKNRHINCL